MAVDSSRTSGGGPARRCACAGVARYAVDASACFTNSSWFTIAPEGETALNTNKPKVKLETDLSYIDKVSGQRIRFIPKPDEIIGTFQPQRDRQTMWKSIRATPLSLAKPVMTERGLAVFRVPAGHDLEAARRTLEAVSVVANTMPVLIDDEGLIRYLVPDELTVQFRDGVPKPEAERLIHAEGCQIVTRQRTSGYYTLAAASGRGLFDTIRRFAALPQVEFAEPSEVGFHFFAYTPDDPRFPEQYALRKINAPAAWDVTRGDPNVIIAIIDTGVDLDHPDLAANILFRGEEDWDFATGGGRVPTDLVGHGSHVAGIAAAVDNSVGIVGVAPQCRLMPLRMTLSENVSFQIGADAIDFVRGHAAAHPDRRYVINLSWGGILPSHAVHRAIKRAVDANIIVVVSAGNFGVDVNEAPRARPAVYPEVIAVANVDQDDKRDPLTNFGAKVDVAAPGMNILSTIPDNAFGLISGTSMAAPHVAGLAALIWSLDKSLTNAQVREIIESTCDNIDAANPGFQNLLGKGRINAFKALAKTAFSISVAPNKVDLPRGGSAILTVGIRRAVSFTSNIILLIPNLPTGISASFQPSNTTGLHSTLTLSVGADVPFGSRDLIVQAISGNVVQTAALQATVKAFALSLSQPDVMLKGDDPELKSADVTVTINRSPGFNDVVQLSVEGLPGSTAQGGAITTTLNPASTNGNAATLHISAGRFAREANFLLTVRAVSGNRSDTVQLDVEVLPANVGGP